MAKNTKVNAEQPYSADTKAMRTSDLRVQDYTGPFTTDAELARLLSKPACQIDSFTLFKKELGAPIVIDPHHLDYDNLLRNFFGSGLDVHAGLLLTLSKWGVVKTAMMELIPKSGSTQRYRRGVPCLTVEEIDRWADEMVKQAAADQRASQLADSRWQIACRMVTTVLLQAMFAPMNIVIGIKPIVEPSHVSTALPNLSDLLAISQHSILKECLVRHNPAAALDGIESLYQLEVGEALRKYFTDLLVDLTTAGYKAERMVRTALAIINQKLLHRAGEVPADELTIPVAYFSAPALDQLCRNFTMVAIATEAAREGESGSPGGALLGEYEYTQAVDYLTTILHSALFLETHPLVDAAKYFSISLLGDSVGRRAGMVIDSQANCQPDIKAYMLRQTGKGYLTELIPGGPSSTAFAAVAGAFPNTSEIDSGAALSRQLTRDSDAWQQSTARLVYADWLVGGTAEMAEKHRIGATPAAFAANTATWLLQLAAAAFATSTYLVRSERGWTFAYLVTPERASLAQRVETLDGTLITNDALLALYLSASEHPQTETWDIQAFDPDVLTKGRVRLATLKSSGLITDTKFLSTDLPVLTGIGSGRADLVLGTLARFLEIPVFANVTFVQQGHFKDAFNAAVARTLSIVSMIDANAKSMQLSDDTVKSDKRLALLPLYMYVLKVARSALFDSRVSTAMNRMIAHAPDYAAKLALSVEAVNAELRADVGCQTVLNVMAGLGFLDAAYVTPVLDAFAELGMHRRIGAVEGSQSAKVMLIM